MNQLHPIFQDIVRNFAPALTCRNFGIDVLTRDKDKLLAELVKLPQMITVRDGGVYREGPEYCQVHVTTTWTERQLDDWLWSSCGGIKYVGIFDMSPETFRGVS